MLEARLASIEMENKSAELRGRQRLLLFKTICGDDEDGDDEGEEGDEDDKGDKDDNHDNDDFEMMPISISSGETSPFDEIKTENRSGSDEKGSKLFDHDHPLVSLPPSEFLDELKSRRLKDEKSHKIVSVRFVHTYVKILTAFLFACGYILMMIIK